MSYARWSEGDVYLYPHIDGYYLCCRCTLCGGDWGDWKSTELLDVLDHLKAHRDAGHTVPQRAFDQVNRELDQLETTKVFCPFCEEWYMTDKYVVFSPGTFHTTCRRCKVEWGITVTIDYWKG